MTIFQRKLNYLVLLLSALVVWFFYTYTKNRLSWSQSGGSRHAIFTRFHYLPDYHSFKPTYNTANAGPPEVIEGRPYRQFTMPAGSWFYPIYLPVGPSTTTGL